MQSLNGKENLENCKILSMVQFIVAMLKFNYNTLKRNMTGNYAKILKHNYVLNFGCIHVETVE